MTTELKKYIMEFVESLPIDKQSRGGLYIKISHHVRENGRGERGAAFTEDSTK